MADEENKTKVTLLTTNYRIKGNIDLLPGARVTDYFIEAKGFIALALGAAPSYAEAAPAACGSCGHPGGPGACQFD